MKTRRLFVLLLVLALFLLPACLQKPEAHCCLYGHAEKGECYFADKLAENPDYRGEADCKIWKEGDEPVFCEVDDFNYSVCSEWETKSCVEGCSGMLCGDFGKIGIPTSVRSEDLEKGNLDLPTGQGAVFNLLHAECNVLKMTPSVEHAMSKGLLLNSFRIGFGTSFDEYDTYRYLFPLSDKVFSSYTATKDRYSNYFFAKRKCMERDGLYRCPENNRKYSSYYECEWECRGLNPAMVCSEGMEKFSLPNSPFGNELGYVKHWYGGLFWADVADERALGSGNTFWSEGKVELQYSDDGRTANVGVLKFAKQDSTLTAATVGIFGFKEIPTYYANVLPRYSVYSSQISEGREAEFECETGLECYSGMCGKDVYKRSACIHASTNESIECGCSYEYGSLVCRPTRTKSVPASDNPKQNAKLWDGEKLGVSRAFLSQEDVLLFTHPTQISKPKASIVNGKVMIFLSRDVASTLGSIVDYPLSNDQATRWAILHYCQVIPTSWTDSCQEGGTYVVNFVKNCMAEEYKDDIAVCYPPKFGLDGSGPDWENICAGLTDDDFCLSKDEVDGGERCNVYAAAAIVIRKNTDGNFGKCAADENGNLLLKEYGWCEPATFNTIAVEHLYPLNEFYDPVSGDPEDESLPLTGTETGGIPRIDLADYDGGPFDDFKDDYKGYDSYDAINKRIANYCPVFEVLPASDLDAKNPNEWEGTTVGEVYTNGRVVRTGDVNARVACGGHKDDQLRCDAYNLAFGCKDATRADGDIYDARVSWPDFYPHWEYMKQKLTSYLVAGVMPVLYAESDAFYKTYYGCDECFYPNPPTDYREDATFAWKLLRDIYANILYSTDYHSEQQTYHAGDYEESASSLGPIIVVVGDAGQRISYEIDLEKRAAEVKEPCPYCMPGISNEITITGLGTQDRNSEEALLKNFDETYGLGMDDHLNGQKFCSRGGFIGEDCNSLMENAGLFVIEMRVDPKVSLDTDEEKAEFYEYTVQKLTNISRKLVFRFGKPSLLVITETAGSVDKAGLFNYIAYQKARLVNSGIIGVHFSNFSLSDSSGLNMQDYCAVESSAEISSGLSPSSFVEDVKVSEECECVECDETDVVKGVCNGYYMGDPSTGFQCSGYSGNQKWPEDCITEQMCLSPEQYGTATLKCRVYNRGEYSLEEYPVEDVMANPSLYSDLIASLKGVPKLCIETETENKTFSSTQSFSLNPTPILFSTSGNESKECVQGKTGYANFCGFDIPLKTRISDCWIEE